MILLDFFWGNARAEVHRGCPETLPDVQDMERDLVAAVPEEAIRSAVNNLTKLSKTSNSSRRRFATGCD